MPAESFWRELLAGPFSQKQETLCEGCLRAGSTEGRRRQTFILRMATFSSLPSDLVERILHKVATIDDSAPQDLCNAESVCKEWKDTAREACWQAILERQLGKATLCRWDEAAWLIRRLHKCKDIVSASAAKHIFKLHGCDLKFVKPARIGVRQYNGHLTMRRHFRKWDLLRTALKKYESVELFREHVWKCAAVAEKRANTTFQKGVERQRQVDEVLGQFDEGVLGVISAAVECFVARNLGTLEGLYRRAINVVERREEVAALLSEHKVGREEVPFCMRSIQLYEEGCVDRGRIVDELSRHVSLNEGLKARGVTLETYSTSISICRLYVRAGGELPDLLDHVELHEFFRAEMGCLDGDDRLLVLTRWMKGMTRAAVLEKAPLSLQDTWEFHKCFTKRFAAAGHGQKN